MPEQLWHINAIPIAQGIDGDPCAQLDKSKTYELVLLYDTVACMWVYRLVEKA